MLKKILILFVFLGILLAVSPLYIQRGIFRNFSDISDYQFFANSIVKKGNSEPWALSSRYNQKGLNLEQENQLKNNKTVAYLVIQNDSILFEHYWDGYSDSSLSNSFSMAKSIITMLAQVAIQKGIFQGWNQKVVTLFPELKGPFAKELELWHLSTMSSGMKWEENYKNPFGITAQAYYGDDIQQLILSLPIDSKPGVAYNYQSGSTQLLGLALIKATGKPLSKLASEWLWKPMQAERDALWHTDEKGTELAYCCFNSNARDFARFGKLMLHNGNWEGTQILDSSFVQMATTGALAPYYGYSFWVVNSYGKPVFCQRGILGQYIITFPERNLVVVRLGHKRLPTRADYHPEDLHVIIDEALKIAEVTC